MGIYLNECLCKPVYAAERQCGLVSQHVFVLLPHCRAVKSCMFAVQCHTGLQQLALWIHTQCCGCHHVNINQNNALKAWINIFKTNEIHIFSSVQGDPKITKSLLFTINKIMHYGKKVVHYIGWKLKCTLQIQTIKWLMHLIVHYIVKQYILFFTLINRFFCKKNPITNRPIIILYANIAC